MIKFKNITKKYNDASVIDNITVTFEEGGIYCLVGQSGSGKTTLMKMINKLILPTSGSILINDKNINDYDILKLRHEIGYVIQKVGLFPHMNVGENITMLARTLKWSEQDAKARAIELLELVNLDAEYYDRYPLELSGGQQQRIGIARALMLNPDIILMDEPFSALDPLTRESIQDELLNLQEELKKSIVFVTHDMDEAIKLADKILIIDAGEIIQFGTPEQILKEPKNEFIESFLGSNRLWKNPDMFYVKDIMVKNVPTLNESASLARALEKINNQEYDFAFITQRVANRNLLKGIITKRVIYENLDAEHKPVRSIMSTKYTTLNSEDNLLDVLNQIDKSIPSVFPVLDNDGYAIGAITPTNLLTMISNISPE